MTASLIVPPRNQKLPEVRKYNTIVADPPWQYRNKSTRNAAAKHYPTMSIGELCDLDVVRECSDDNAHLYLWSTSSHLPEAFSVMASWGFTYKTYLVWSKTQLGLGNYFRVSTEIVLFGVKGSLPTHTTDKRNHFEAPRRKHSQKPPQFHDLVEASSPGPYLELFSRCWGAPTCECSKCRLGWDVWGNES
jgi:N6-adenosine-specific RNA methylase IME4